MLLTRFVVLYHAIGWWFREWNNQRYNGWCWNRWNSCSNRRLQRNNECPARDWYICNNHYPIERKWRRCRDYISNHIFECWRWITYSGNRIHWCFSARISRHVIGEHDAVIAYKISLFFFYFHNLASMFSKHI